MVNLKRHVCSFIGKAIFLAFISLSLLNYEATGQTCSVLYVSPTGSASGAGTTTNPYDLATALSKAHSGGIDNIRLLQGIYGITSIISLESNVTLDGGYIINASNGDWVKSSAVTTELNMSGTGIDSTFGVEYVMGFQAVNVSGWTLQDLTIHVAAASGTYNNSSGISVYGVYLSGVGSYNIIRCVINTGDASGGKTAADLNGSGGGYNGGAGGSGNTNTGSYCGGCGNTGNTGNPGSQQYGTENGGGGGAGCCSSGCNFAGCSSYGCSAGNGNNGDGGVAGPSYGSAASNTSGLLQMYIPVTGATGNPGDGGAGGGGGGSGAYGTCCDDPTNCGTEDLNGGNGGNGGQGGAGGNGGYGGGGSFGVYANSSSGTIGDCSINPGSGGSGGAGGAGNAGQSGGGGSPGSANNAARGGSGGNGGNGGDGGNGGQGQTGANGPSYDIYNVGSGSSNGTSVPDPTTVTVDYSNSNACTNSEITITKGTGTWVLPSGATFVNDLTPSTSSYTASSDTAIISFNATGAYNLGADGSTYESFIYINSAGSSSPTINTLSNLNSNGTLCAGLAVDLGTSASGDQYEWLIYSDTINGPNSPLQSYSTQTPGNTPAFSTYGKYYIRLRVHSSCCGWSLPVFADFTVVPNDTISAGSNQLICTGSDVVLNVTGSSGTYKWSTNQTGPSITVHPTTPTLYTVTVTDANGCTASSSVDINVSTGLTIDSFRVHPILCNGGTASAVVVASGGVPFTSGYEYHWNVSSTTDSVAGLTTGSYFATVTDSAGCTASSSFNISQPTAISYSNVTFNTILCNGANTGTISVFASGGTGSMQYSIDNGTTYQASNTFNGLVAGSYNVVVQDVNGCSLAYSGNPVTITQPSQPLAIVIDSVSEPSCNGVNNGAIYVSASGGAGSYQYSLNGSPLQPGSTFTTLSAGFYNVVVQDGNDCQANQSVTLHNRAGVVLVVDTVYSIACNGQDNGEILVSATSGTEPYSYTINGFAYQASDTFINLNAGVYSVEVKDAAGCTAIQSATVNEPPALVVTVDSVQNAGCNGGSTGNIYISVTGGTGQYTYSWTGGINTQDLLGVTAGNYAVTVTDSNNCTATATAVITQPNALYITLANPATVTCYGGSDGALYISVFGGTPPFTYAWSNGDTLQDATDLSSGPYTITVTDAASCQIVNTFTVNSPAAPINITADVSNASCSGGGNNGAIGVNVSGGVIPYIYSWSNNATTDSISNLSIGTYDVKVTDSLGCTAFGSYNITTGAGLSVTVDSTHNAGCTGNAGAIYISVSGGSGHYGYAWTGGVTTQNISGLSAGTYSVTVTDSVSGCSGTASAAVGGSVALSITLTSPGAVSCYGGNNGQLDIEVTGGASPYSFAWSNGQTLQNATDLIAGPYSVTVTDINSCQLADTFTVTQPAAALSLTASVHNATCSGAGNNGSVALTVSGGLAPYSYSWSNSATTDSIGGLISGTYDVKVTDSLGCTDFASYNVANGGGLVVALDSTHSAGCSGNLGAVYIGVSGGSGHYGYSWTGGATTQNISGLTAGNYSVTVSDSISGCAGTLTATVSGSAPLAISLANAATVICYGGNTGQLNISVTGGTTPYSFVWSNGQTLQDASSLTAGSYSVSVTDHQGCKLADTFRVTQPDSALYLFPNLQGATCSGGGDDGSVNLVVSGGVPPYSYIWSNGVTTAQPYDLTPGVYDVKVTDSLGCTAYGSYVIDSAIPPVLVIDSVHNVDCNGNHTGSIYLGVTGGTGNFTYNWTGGATSPNLLDVVAGTYTVTVTNGGCTPTITATITQPGPLAVTLANEVSASCYGSASGSLLINVTGGTLPYHFEWSNGASSQDLDNLVAGTYKLTVTDAHSCDLIDSFAVSQPSAALSLSASIIDATCTGGGADGSAALTVTGGLPPYSFDWSNGTTNDTLKNVNAGTYDVKVTDSLGCTIFASYVVGGSTGLTVVLDSIHEVNCNGNSTGAVYISVSGGSGNYSYAWTGGSTSANLAGVVAGTYTVTVTDQSGGCAGILTATVTQPAALSVSLTGPTTVTCFGGSDGNIDLNVAGGTGPYSFAWSSGGTLQNATDLSAGPYTVTVTDVNGCFSLDTFTVTQPSSPISITPAITNASCLGGGGNGSISLTVTGGDSPYSYSWNTGATMDTISNLSAGAYDVKVTDSLGCTIFASYTVGGSSGLTVSLDTVININCNGNSTGAILISVFGGSGSYGYAWTGGATSANLTGVVAGTYTVTVTDSISACTGTLTTTISQPNSLQVSLAGPATVTCFGGSDGSLDLNVSGGTAPYSFAWSTGGALQNATDLPAGPYSVTITDANSCLSIDTFSISQPAQALLVFPLISNATCAGGGNDGSISVTAFGGVPPYTYSWNVGATTSSIDSLTGGTYDVKVTDSLGCTVFASYNVGSTTSLTVTLDSAINVDCFGNSTGSIFIHVSGGSGSYFYSWTGGATTADLLDVPAGVYTVTVSDSLSGCGGTLTHTITQPNAITIQLESAARVSCYGGNDGNINIVLSGGRRPFSFLWSTGDTTQNIHQLIAGGYSVTVTDAHGCQLADTFTVTQPASPLGVSAVVNNATCAGGGNNGSIVLTVSGGLPPYIYGWDNGDTTATADSLGAGAYDVKIIDSLGCSITDRYTIKAANPLTVKTDSVVEVDCNGNNTGSVYISVSGGSGSYSYLWTGGATTQNLIGVPAGSYTVTATDSNGSGCTGTLTVNVTQPAALAVSLVAPGVVTCFGGSDGVLDIGVTGGTHPYSFAWSTGGTLQNATDLSVGQYTVTVTDAHLCQSVDTFNVTGPSSALSISPVITSASCAGGGSDGSIVVTVSGGVPPYTYNWNNGSTSDTAGNLAPGPYTVNVSDSLGCSLVAVYNVGSSAGLTVSLDTVINVNCNGNSTGAILINVAGGSGNYVYSWTGGTTMANLIGVVAGTYSVTVTDSISGCTGTLTVTIGQPAPLTVSLAGPATVTCFGGNDGALDLNVSGGTAPYSFAWSTGGTLQNATNLAAGQYNVTITDANSCQSIDTFTVGSPAAALSVIPTITNATCAGAGSNGSISLIVTGGVAPYSYTWNTGATTDTIANLITGNYSVKVTDSLGCTFFASYTVGGATGLTVTLDSIVNANCNGNSTGAVYINVANGSGTYGYSWTGGATTANLVGVLAGNYSVTVTDSTTGCTGTLTATVSQPAPLVVSLTNVPTASCFGDNNGTLDINVTGGTGAYSYSWSTGSTQQDISDLLAGKYFVTVTDVNSCRSVDTFTVTQPASALSVTPVVNNATCSGGGSNGSIALTVTGGLSPYTYTWSTGATTSGINNLIGGNYTVLIADSLGCTLFESYTIGAANALLVTLDSVVNVDCNGNSTGAVYIDVNGGSGGYSYSWTGGSSSQNLTGVATGNYTVTVSDNNSGCSGTLTTTVAQPAILQATAAVTNVTCSGAGNGSIALTVTGGTSPYSYNWSVPGTGSTINGLRGTTYSVTVTDKNNCSFTNSYSVYEPAPLTVQANIVNISCNGTGGDIFLTATGGTPSYYYNWSNDSTTASVTGQDAGTYHVTVTDNNGCSITDTFTIHGASSSISVSLSPTNVKCFGDSTGSITSTVTGGVPIITYLWSNGSTADNLSSIPAGVYNLVVLDGNGCSASASTAVNQPNQLTLTNSIVNVACNGNSTGSITVTAKGGVAPYTFNWSTGQSNTGVTSSTSGGDTVGSYGLTVTDANQCSVAASYSITGASPIELSDQVTNASCNGEHNGAIRLTVLGGSGSYSFGWSDGSSTQNISGLVSGPYTVTVTDNIGGCTASLTDTVRQPAAIALQGSIANVTCAGLNNGEVFLTVAGGTPNYSYNWNNLATTQDILSVAGGTYTVTVTDNNNCTAVGSFQVVEPQAIALSITPTDVNCYGQSTGSATLTVNGGTAPYNFLWSNFATGQDLVNIPAGVYTVVVTDSGGCTKTDTVNITQNLAIVVTDSINNVSCFGGSNGSITLTVSGGNPGYLYNWSNNQSGSAITDLQAGTYGVTISDNAGCSVIESYPITQPDSNQLIFTVSNVKCYGGDNGNISVSVNGGVPPYSFHWADNVNTGDRPDITAGFYQVTFSDANGCSVVDTFNITQPTALSLTMSADSVTCNGLSNGSASVSVTGGVTPYTYFWSNFNFTSAVSSVPAGNYAVIVTDSNACTQVDSIVVGQPAVLQVSGQTIDAGCGNSNSGEANTTVTGGTPPYTYVWSNNDSTQDISNLPAGTYTLTVEDDHGCDALFTAVILSYPVPVASFTYNVACAGQATDFVSTATITEGTIIYDWYFGDGDSSYLADAVHTYGVPNTYNVELIVKSERGCTDTITEPVFVSALPTAALLVNGIQTSNICVGDSAVLSLTDTNSMNLHDWSTGDTTSSILVNFSGIYSVTVTNPSGCAVSDTVTLNIYQSSELGVTPTDTTISLGFSVQLQAVGGTTYIWSPSAGLSDSTIADPIATPTMTTTYTVTIYPDSSCSARRVVTINVENDTLLLPPNVFTPNGDGIHDTWVIANIGNYPACQVLVFDRYGTQVYSASDYQNNWDGTSGGKALPDGTYYYIIKCGGSKVYKGAVNILR